MKRCLRTETVIGSMDATAGGGHGHEARRPFTCRHAEPPSHVRDPRSGHRRRRGRRVTVPMVGTSLFPVQRAIRTVTGMKVGVYLHYQNTDDWSRFLDKSDV